MDKKVQQVVSTVLSCILLYGARGFYFPAADLYLPSEVWRYSSVILGLIGGYLFMRWIARKRKLETGTLWKAFKSGVYFLFGVLIMSFLFYAGFMGLGEGVVHLSGDAVVMRLDVTKDASTTKKVARIHRTSGQNVQAYCVQNELFKKASLRDEYCQLSADHYQRLPDASPMDFDAKTGFMGTVIGSYNMP